MLHSWGKQSEPLAAYHPPQVLGPQNHSEMSCVLATLLTMALAKIFPQFSPVFKGLGVMGEGA